MGIKSYMEWRKQWAVHDIQWCVDLYVGLVDRNILDGGSPHYTEHWVYKTLDMGQHTFGVGMKIQCGSHCQEHTQVYTPDMDHQRSQDDTGKQICSLWVGTWHWHHKDSFHKELWV